MARVNQSENNRRKIGKWINSVVLTHAALPTGVPPQEAVRVLSVEQDSVTLALPRTSTSAGYTLQIDYSSGSHGGTMVLEDYKTVKVTDLHPDGKYTFTIRRVAEDGRQSIATSLWAKTGLEKLVTKS